MCGCGFARGAVVDLLALHGISGRFLLPGARWEGEKVIVSDGETPWWDEKAAMWRAPLPHGWGFYESMGPGTLPHKIGPKAPAGARGVPACPRNRPLPEEWLRWAHYCILGIQDERMRREEDEGGLAWLEDIVHGNWRLYDLITAAQMDMEWEKTGGGRYDAAHYAASLEEDGKHGGLSPAWMDLAAYLAMSCEELREDSRRQVAEKVAAQRAEDAADDGVARAAQMLWGESQDWWSLAEPDLSAH
jgi:hypothetical protein